MNYTDELARFMAEIELDDIPKDVLRLARVSILDALGLMLAGHAFLENEGQAELGLYLDSLSGAEQATALGFHRRGPWFAATFANGTLIEVLDWQDTTMSARLHSGSGTIPAVIAAAEWRGLAGREMLKAIAVGYETGARVGVAIQPSHWYNGFQATGTIGALGAAAAVGSLFRFDHGTMSNLLGVCGHILAISNGDGVFQGYNVKTIHGGMAAQAGMQAALLTGSGYEAGPLEGLPPRYHGFMNIASDEMDASRISRDLGSEWVSRDCSHKAYPVGLLNIGPVEVTSGLVEEHGIKAEEVESVDVTSYSDTLHFVGRHYTDTSSTFADCYLSLPYTVAATIVSGEFGVEQLTRRRIADPAVHELGSRIKVHVDERMDDLYPKEWPVLVDIELKDGRRVSRRLDRVIGCPQRPMTDEELSAKFLRNAEPVLGAERASGVLERCMELEQLEQPSELIELLRPAR